MKTATVSELRNNFGRIESWLDRGEPVEITRRGKDYAVIQPKRKPAKRKFQMPDFRAQLKEIWGDRPPFTAAQVKEMQDWEDNES
ncbi:MAG: type II toxin-antitoxin system Phd/YefM family antitoxin [Verrucomicrobiales bacterium]|jgi:prevent-host-death family protein|nr:type II toxin-antitoxin system Phd/YefM family antitoxin [Verrucomicrobiales bacterium]